MFAHAAEYEVAIVVKGDGRISYGKRPRERFQGGGRFVYSRRPQARDCVDRDGRS